MATTLEATLEMQPKLRLLFLLLNAIGVGTDINSLEDRKRVQKAVYLAQRAGVDLGYRYGWYLLGPYCPDLTQDYYELAVAQQIGEGVNGSRLSERDAAKLHELRPLLEVPGGVDLPSEDWLELLASVDYLRKVRGYGEDRVDEVVHVKKHELERWLNAAKHQLERMPLVA